MNPSPNKKYPYQVWGSTLISTPIVISLMKLIKNYSLFSPESLGSEFIFILFILFISVITSLPALFLYRFSFARFSHLSISFVRVKSILSFTAICSTILTFILVDKILIELWRKGLSSIEITIAYPVIYSITIAVTGYYFKLTDSEECSTRTTLNFKL